jgi:hypothetical protein
MDGDQGTAGPAQRQFRRRIPAGLNEASYEAVRQAVLIARQHGTDEGKAAREVAWGQHPALPLPMIWDAAEEARWLAVSGD